MISKAEYVFRFTLYAYAYMLAYLSLSLNETSRLQIFRSLSLSKLLYVCIAWLLLIANSTQILILNHKLFTFASFNFVRPKIQVNKHFIGFFGAKIESTEFKFGIMQNDQHISIETNQSMMQCMQKMVMIMIAMEEEENRINIIHAIKIAPTLQFAKQSQNRTQFIFVYSTVSLADYYDTHSRTRYNMLKYRLSKLTRN